MSMTLEEAIEHAEKVAEENEKISLYTPVEYIPADLSIEQCQNCADDHRQLAEWLKELKVVKDLIKQHDEDSMPEDFWYIDKIRKAVQE